jgi:hypothetical protein
MASGSASSLTEAEPSVRRSTIARRVGSESAWNVRSRGAGCWLSTHLSITTHGATKDLSQDELCGGMPRGAEVRVACSFEWSRKHPPL